jgi:uncharacterized protein (DUF2249 family)
MLQIAKQTKLRWDMERETREVWKMSKESLKDAASIITELLKKGSTIVTFSDVVRISLDISTPDIPEHYVHAFSNQLEALTEEQWKVRQLIEQAGEFRLVTLNSKGRDTWSGDSSAAAFGLYESPAGELGEIAQLKAAIGKLKTVGNRRIERTGSDGDIFAGIMSEIETRLLPAIPEQQ